MPAKKIVIKLPPIRKLTYRPPHSVLSRSQAEVDKWFTKNKVKVKELANVRPILYFVESTLPASIVGKLMAGSYAIQPIQSITWPLALAGNDVNAMVKSVSSHNDALIHRTLSYLLPAIAHVMNQIPPPNGAGPLVLVLLPTRDLVKEVELIARAFCLCVFASSCAIYDGAPTASYVEKWTKGVDVCITAPATPFIHAQIASLKRCSVLVLDEADRMLDMGFEPQIREIASKIRPDRQTMMFSAASSSGISKWASNFQRSPVHLTIGAAGSGSTSRAKGGFEEEEDEDEEDAEQPTERRKSSRILARDPRLPPPPPKKRRRAKKGRLTPAKKRHQTRGKPNKQPPLNSDDERQQIADECSGEHDPMEVVQLRQSSPALYAQAYSGECVRPLRIVRGPITTWCNICEFEFDSYAVLWPGCSLDFQLGGAGVTIIPADDVPLDIMREYERDQGAFEGVDQLGVDQLINIAMCKDEDELPVGSDAQTMPGQKKKKRSRAERALRKLKYESGQLKSDQGEPAGSAPASSCSSSLSKAERTKKWFLDRVERIEAQKKKKEARKEQQQKEC